MKYKEPEKLTCLMSESAIYSDIRYDALNYFMALP